MSFRRSAIAPVVAGLTILTILGCGNKIPVESPAGSGDSESASQASKASTDEISAKLDGDSYSKSGHGRRDGWERYVAALTDSLGLSDDQVADLDELYEDYRADVKAAMDDARESGDRSELRTKLKELRQGFEDEFNDVLTDEQQTRLEEIKANAIARRKDKGWGNSVAALTDSLDLSDQQITDLNELYDDYQADVKAAIDSAQESGDRSGLRDQLRELKEDFEEDFNAVLTDEQKEKLDEMKSGRRKQSGKGHGRGRKGRNG